MAQSQTPGPSELRLFEEWMETTKWLMSRTERFPKRLSRLRVIMRLAHELKILSHAQYEEAARRFDDAGRMLGAWIKQQQEKKK